MDRLKAIVFDLDDTLHPELEYVRSGFMAVATSLNESQAQTHFDSLWNLFNTADRGHVFDLFLESRTHLGRTVEDMISVYRDHTPSIKLSQDILEFLDWVREVGLSTAIISDGYHAVQRKKITALGLDSQVELVVLTDCWGRNFWKPNEHAFLTVESHFGLRGQSLVYIGDNLRKDFIAPNKLGWRTIQYAQEGQFYADVTLESSDARATHIVSSVAELREKVWSWIK